VKPATGNGTSEVHTDLDDIMGTQRNTRAKNLANKLSKYKYMFTRLYTNGNGMRRASG
jgi:hypothetical protein